MSTNTPPMDLPELPDIDELRAAATARVKYFTNERDAMQAELDQAQSILNALNGHGKRRRKRTGQTAQPRPTDATYERILMALADHSYCGVNTLAQKSGFSASHCARTMKVGEERGHVLLEWHGRKLRYKISDEGMDFLTRHQEGADG